MFFDQQGKHGKERKERKHAPQHAQREMNKHFLGHERDEKVGARVKQPQLIGEKQLVQKGENGVEVCQRVHNDAQRGHKKEDKSPKKGKALAAVHQEKRKGCHRRQHQTDIRRQRNTVHQRPYIKKMNGFIIMERMGGRVGIVRFVTEKRRQLQGKLRICALVNAQMRCLRIAVKAIKQQLFILRHAVNSAARCPQGEQQADKGSHSFTYRLYPHSGSWQESRLLEHAFSLNNPMRVYKLAANGAKGEGEQQFIRISRKGVVLDAYKAAQDGDGIILRVYEALSSRGKVEITLPGEINSVTECNLMELDEQAVAHCGSSFTFEIKPNEVRSFRIK